MSLPPAAVPPSDRASGDPRHAIRPATLSDAPLVLAMIRELAAYERLAHEVDAT